MADEAHIERVENTGQGYVRVDGYANGEKVSAHVPKEALDRAEKEGGKVARELLRESLITSADYERERRR